MMSHTLRQFLFVCSFLSVVSSFGQTTDWMFTTDNNGREVALDIARDPSQHCFYVVGYFEGLLSEAYTFTSSTNEDFPLNLQSVGGTDAFVARLSEDGELEWIQVIGSSNNDQALTVAVGANGLVYVGGYVSGITQTLPVNFGQVISGNPGQPFLAKFNANGQLMGGESYPTPSSAMIADIECNATSIHLLFQYRNQTFSSVQFSTPADTQYQVQQRSYQNNVMWTASFGAAGSSVDASEVEILRPKMALHNGQVFLTGVYDSNNFSIVASADNSAGAILFPIDNGYRIFVASLTDIGTLNWIQTTSGVNQMPQGFGLAADCSGVYLGGAIDFANSTTFPGGYATGGTPQERMFLSRLNVNTGSTEWVLQVPSTGGVKDDVITSIDVDARGNIICGGFVKLGLQLPGLPAYSGDSEEAVLFACDPDGNLQWGKFFTGDDKDRIFGLTTAGDGRVAFCGESGRGLELLLDSDVQDGDNAFAGLVSYSSANAPTCCISPAGGIISSPNLSPCAGEPLVIYHNLLEEQRVVQYSLLGFGWTTIAPVTQNPMLIENPSPGFYRIVTTYAGCGSANSNVIQSATGVSVSLACPADKYVFADASCEFVLPDYTGEVIIAGACAVEFVQSPAAGTIVGLGDHTITVEAQVAGLTLSSCQFQIEVADGTPPSLVCPSTQTRYTVIGCDYKIEDFRPLVAASDNCGNVTLTQTPGIGNDLSNGTYVVSIAAIDDAGNTNECSFNLIVQSGNATMTCPGDQLVQLTPDACDFVLPDYTELTAVSGYCNSTTLTQSPAPGTLLGPGLYTIDILLTDDDGNTQTCSFDVSVQDIHAPALAIIPDQSLNITTGCSISIPSFTALVNTTNACETLTITQNPAAGSIRSAGVYLVTMNVADASGNTSTEQFTLNIEDGSAPLVSYPSLLTATSNADCLFEVPSYASVLTISDNCSAWTVDQSPSPGEEVGVGTHEIFFDVEDASGNITSFSILLEVSPFGGWTVVCEPNITVEASSGSCNAVVSLTPPSTVGLCIGYSVTNNAPSVFPIGSTEVVWTVSADDGSSQNCSQFVVVTESNPPSIVCPNEQALFIVNGCTTSLPNYTGLVSANDNCSGISLVQSPSPGSIIGVGSHTIVFTATDANGNSATCEMIVSVKDTNSPDLVCPADLSRVITGTCSYALEDFTSTINATDDCGSVTIAQSPLPGTVLTPGNHVVSILVTDISGNISSCSFDVLVEDNTLPAVVCPAPASTITDSNECYATYLLEAPVVTDNCGVSSVTNDAPVVFPLGTTNVVWTVVDNSGNSATCSTSVFVQDVSEPVFTCPNDRVETAINCVYNLPDFWDVVSVSDCQSVTLNQVPVAGTILSSGTHTILLSAEDMSGNTHSCSFQIQVVDEDAPTVVCPTDRTVFADQNCIYEVENFLAEVSASDGCSQTVISQSPAPGVSLTTGTHEVVIQATDASGNFSSCSFFVTVVDNELPSIVCPADIEVANDPGMCGSAVVLDIPITEDNCGVDEVSNNAPTLFPIGSTEVVWTVTDVNGLSSTCIQHVVVVDVELPAITCITDQVVEVDENCGYAMPDFNSQIVSSDNCIITSYSQQPSAGDILHPGVHQVTITVTDGAGNSAVCMFSIAVEDNQAPSQTCLSNEVVFVDDDCQFVLPDYTLNWEVSDNCGIASVLQNPAAGSAIGLGLHEIILTVTDVNGNSSSCSFELEVQSDQTPALQCADDVVLELPANACSIPYTSPSPLVENICGDYDLSYNGDDEFTVGLHTVEWTVVDVFGNENTCIQTLEVLDVNAPVFDCLNDTIRYITSECVYVLEDFTAMVESSDACGVISIEQIPLPETLLGIGEHEIQISVADSNNNVATCAFTVTVLDSIAPVIACSASTQDVFEACLTSVPDLSSQLLVTECTSYTIDQNPLPGTVITPGSATIIFTVTDEFGLSATCSTEYSFESTIGLEIACDLPQDISVSSCTFDLPDYTSDIEVLSSCGEVVFTQIPAPGTVISSSVVEVTITAVDANGNTAFCGSSINFFYFSDIVMECPADVEIQLDESCSAIADFPLPLLSGGCGEVILTQTGGPNVGEQLTAGVYTISFEAHDGFGNSSSCSFALNVIDAIAPDIICGPNVVSCIPNVVPEWPTATDNCGEVTITLSPDVVWSQGTAFPQGLTQLIFVAEDNFGNTSQCITNIQINQPVAPNWFVNEHLCIEDEDIDLNSLLPSNGEFSWEGNVFDDHILSPATLGEGAYSITLVSQNGICLLDSTLNFTVGSRPEVSVGEDITVCGLVADGEGESTSTDVQWTSVPGTDILGVYTLTPTLQADTYGTYNFSMYAFGTFGCFASDTLAVTFVEPPVPILTSVESLNMLSGQTIEIPYSNPGTGEVVVMTGSETGITVVREPSVLEVTGNIPGEYIIEMYTVNIPCPAEQVNLKVNVVELEIPTGFSPNGDGVNDFYEINAIELFPLLQLRVFDRDGNLMYYAPSYDNTWDGTSIRGNELPAGTYFLVATTAEGRTIESYLIIRRS